MHRASARVVFAALVLGNSLLSGQAPGSEARFEVASLKLSVPASDGSRSSTKHGGGVNSASPGQVSYTNVSLRDFLADAYGLRLDQVIGPAWMDTQHLDLAAKVPRGAARADVRAMIKTLLTERLELKLHHENREMPVYLLAFRNFGPKLKPATAAEIAAVGAATVLDEAGRANGFPSHVPAGRVGSNGGHGVLRIRGVAFRMDALIRMLAAFRTDRPVIDQTGLDGRYDFTLQFSTEGQGRGLRDTQPLDAANSQPTLIEALHEQLGLRVSATKAPVDTVVVDSCRRVPIEN